VRAAELRSTEIVLTNGISSYTQIQTAAARPLLASVSQSAVDISAELLEFASQVEGLCPSWDVPLSSAQKFGELVGLPKKLAPGKAVVFFNSEGGAGFAIENCHACSASVGGGWGSLANGAIRASAMLHAVMAPTYAESLLFLERAVKVLGHRLSASEAGQLGGTTAQQALMREAQTLAGDIPSPEGVVLTAAALSTVAAAIYPELMFGGLGAANGQQAHARGADAGRQHPISRGCGPHHCNTLHCGCHLRQGADVWRPGGCQRSAERSAGTCARRRRWPATSHLPRVSTCVTLALQHALAYLCSNPGFGLYRRRTLFGARGPTFRCVGRGTLCGGGGSSGFVGVWWCSLARGPRTRGTRTRGTRTRTHTAR
jgi:hypothetical protein